MGKERESNPSTPEIHNIKNERTRNYFLGRRIPTESGEYELRVELKPIARQMVG